MMEKGVETIGVVQTIIPAPAGFELLTVRLLSEYEVELDGRCPIIGWMVDYLGERTRPITPRRHSSYRNPTGILSPNGWVLSSSDRSYESIGAWLADEETIRQARIG